MARRLKMAQQTTIVPLHESGHSNRETTRLTGIHRETVAKYVAGDDSKPAKRDPWVHSGPKNCCQPSRELIRETLDQGLSGAHIYQDLRDDHGFSASYSSVRHFVRGLRRATPLPIRRMESAAGEEAQVDFETAAPVIDQAMWKKKRPWSFRIVLSHSRKAYSEVVWRQSTDNFITCMENAFH